MKRPVETIPKLLYTILTLFANSMATVLGLVIIRWILTAIMSKIELTQTQINVFSVIPMFVLELALSWGIIFIFFKNQFPKLYEVSEDKNLMIKKMVSFIWIGESIRFIICLFRLGLGNLAATVQNMYMLTYLKWFDRYYAVRQLGETHFGDYFAYIVCYLIYFAIFMIGIYFICKWLWNKGKMDYDDLIRPNKENFTNHKRPY